MTDADERACTASHEAGHGVVALIFRVPFELLSIRPGATFSGVALLGATTPGASRERREEEILVTVAGFLAAGIDPGGPAAYMSGSEDELLAEAAVAALDAPVAARLFASEADATEGNDTQSAWLSSRVLCGDDAVTAAHLRYLEARAGALIAEHRRHIADVARELLVRTVLTYPEVKAIFNAVVLECYCHAKGIQ